LTFTVVHEGGHTIVARISGDPDAIFYLARIGQGGQGMCLGCNITDHSKISPFGNLLVSLGGLAFTQTTALFALVMMRFTTSRAVLNWLLAPIALGFAFLDVPVQVVQGLLYNIEQHTWPTGVDLMDAMILVSGWTGAPQALLKTILAILASAYLYLFWRSFSRVREIRIADLV
jgi:hypothetical protein